jgi:hypothetical protein
MTLPGFTAEVGTAAPAATYGSLSSAGFGGAALTAVVAAAFGFHLPVFRCCRRAPLFGNRLVCSQRAYFPGQSCTCTATLSGPLITCTGPVLTS